MKKQETLPQSTVNSYDNKVKSENKQSEKHTVPRDEEYNIDDQEANENQDETAKAKMMAPESKTKTEEENRKVKGLIDVNDEEMLDHEKATQNDKLSIKPDKVMKIIAASTISTLQTETNTTPLKVIPLTTYKFQNVDKSIQAAYGITPYLMTSEIPQMFKFKAVYNDAQEVNIPDIMKIGFKEQGINDMVAETIRLFNIKTMTVRIELNETIGLRKTMDPNDLKDGSIKLQTLVSSSRVNPQTSVNFIENRIFSVLNAFLGLDNILITMPVKLIPSEQPNAGEVAQALVSMPIFQNQHPHPYYAVFSNFPSWAIEHLSQQYAINPLQIGDVAINSYGGKKLSQVNKLVIDQYTAAVLRLNFDKLRNNTLTTNTLLEKVNASTLRYDRVSVNKLVDLEDFSVLYNYTDAEYDLFLFRMLTDPDMQTQATNFLYEELVKTNRLTSVKLADVWSGILTSDLTSVSFNDKWLRSVNVGDEHSAYQMLIFETFADYYDFQLSFPYIPNSMEAITEIFNLYVFMILYPRISQRIMHHLGYRLTSLYRAMFPQIFMVIRTHFGEIRTEFGKKKFDSGGYQLSRTESQLGYVYSVLTQLPQIKDSSGNPALKNMTNKFIGLVNSLRRLVQPTEYQHDLGKKRIANYPYLYDSYTAYASWTPIQHTDYQTSQIGELGDKLQAIFAHAETLKTLYATQNSDTAQIPRGFEQYYTSWVNQMSKIVSTAGNVYQITHAMLQETLFNSPFFVGSSYNPSPSKFWFVQNDIAIGPLQSASLTSLVIPSRISVQNFKINIAICLAMTVEGEYLRNVITPREGVNSGSDSNRIRDDVRTIDSVSCFQMMNSLVAQAREFGIAMQMTQWLTTSEDPDNPFRLLAAEIAKYMKMASWTPLVRKVFAYLNLDFDRFFVHNMGSNQFTVDARFLDRTLVTVNPSTGMALPQQPLDAKFGKKFTYMVPMDIEKMRILSRPLLSMDSKIIYIHRDWYIGKMIVDEMGPTQTDLASVNWTDVTTINKHFIITTIAYKKGQASQISYLSEVDGLTKSIILPYTSKSVGKLLIQMEYLNEIPEQFISVLAEAAAEGMIIFRAKYMKIKVTLEDKPSRTENYSEPPMTQSDFENVLKMPAGSIMERTFITTSYATNFVSNVLTRTAYIQWFATPTHADKNIFASVITNSIEQLDQTILPTADEMGYGPDDEGLLLPNHVPKIESNIINWNNSIPTVSPTLINSIELNVEPSIPQYLGSV